MTELQQIEFDKLKIQIGQISSKTDGIYYALVGNDLSRDGGLVRQINDMKSQQEKFELEIEVRIKKLEDAFTRWKGFAAGLFLAGGVVGFLLKVIINLYFKH